MEEKFDDARTVGGQVLLKVSDRPIPVVPQLSVVSWGVAKPLLAQNPAMHAHDEHFLVVGPVEYADAITAIQNRRLLCLANVSTTSNVEDGRSKPKLIV